MESSFELCDVTFLGMMPYPVQGELFWGPTIGRRLFKAFWQREPIGHLPAWVHGVARQLAQFQNVPLLSDVANKILGLLKGQKITKVIVDPNRPWTAAKSTFPRYGDEAINWICHRYRKGGLTPGMVARDLEVIEAITTIPVVVCLMSLDIILIEDDL